MTPEPFAELLASADAVVARWEPRWRDARTDLPPIGATAVGITDHGHLVVVERLDGAWWGDGPYDGQIEYSVTHWMPLPEPPEVAA